MIRIQSEDGNLARIIQSENEPVSFFETYGFMTPSHFHARQRMRKASGLALSDPFPIFEFSLDPKLGGHELKSQGLCEIEKLESNRWRLKTPMGPYFVERLEAIEETSRFGWHEFPEEEKPSRLPFIIPALMGVIIALALAYRFFKTPDVPVVEQPPVVAPVIVQPAQPRVTVNPEKEVQPKNQAIDKQAKVRKALTQNLGFLKLMGRKDLKKAMGGLPTQTLNASPGAGPGGTEGSGGEILVGLGQGLRKTTVGNTGVAGLGGIGTKGAGGGLGGYGDTDLGSGGGRSISAIPLAQDAVIDGGLDRALIQATIMRYLSQVRACYENGLKRRPELIGQVTMNFEINGTGLLNYSHVQRSSLGDRDVEGCISTRMMTWKFPLPRGGVNVKVSYPFMLRPVNS